MKSIAPSVGEATRVPRRNELSLAGWDDLSEKEV